MKSITIKRKINYIPFREVGHDGPPQGPPSGLIVYLHACDDAVFVIVWAEL
jgi:hypothetical protein